jgi:hypothetical protein
MRASLIWVAVGSLASLAVAACGSSKSKSGSNGPPDPTQLSDPLAAGLTITSIAGFQTLKIPLAAGGNPADHGRVPIVAGRDLLVRVYVTPDSTFTAGKTITAHIKLANPSPTGETVTEVLTAAMAVNGVSTESDLTSTFNFTVPGGLVTPETQYSVVLNDTSAAKGSAGDPNNATYPTDGSLDQLGAQSSGPQIKVKIVPVKYMADGSGRLPDTSDPVIKAVHDIMYNLYPTPAVEITLRDPWEWSQPIDASGAGWDEILMALQKLRGQDQVPFDVYYYAMFAPAASFDAYCGGGCIAGLSFISQPVSSGIGFGTTNGGSGDDVTSTTMAHEVGHAHGRQHAPCGGAGNPDPAFPYPGGGDGVWGYDQIAGALKDPAQYKDIMGYCSPNWISDYHYAKIFTRVRGDNHVGFDEVQRERRQYRMVAVDGAGHAKWGDTAWLDRRPLGVEDDHAVRYLGADGSVVAAETGFFAKYSHLPGGVVFVPEVDAPVARVRIDGYGEVIARAVAR